MGSEIIIVTILGIGLGFTIIYLLNKFFKILDKFYTRKYDKIIKDPHKLKKELEKHGKIFSMGKEVSFDITNDKDGKEVLNMNVSKEDYDPLKQKIKLKKTIKDQERKLKAIKKKKIKKKPKKSKKK